MLCHVAREDARGLILHLALLHKGIISHLGHG